VDTRTGPRWANPRSARAASSSPAGGGHQSWHQRLASSTGPPRT
jgi:hypothetical protein